MTPVAARLHQSTKHCSENRITRTYPSLPTGQVPVVIGVSAALEQSPACFFRQSPPVRQAATVNSIRR